MLDNNSNFSTEEKDFLNQLKEGFSSNIDAANKALGNRMESYCQKNDLNCIVFSKKENGALCVAGIQKYSHERHILSDEDILDCIMGSFTQFALLMSSTGMKIEPIKDLFVKIIKDILSTAIECEGNFIFNYELDSPNFYKFGGIVVNIGSYLEKELNKIEI